MGLSEGRRRKTIRFVFLFPFSGPTRFIMDIMDYFRADLNELNAPDSPNVEDLEIEAFGMCHCC